MGFKEDYIFWSFVHQLSADHGYRIITMSEDHSEIWLENRTNRESPFVRLMRHDLDWANWLRRDIERTAMNGEQVRKQIYHKPMKLVNIYISSFMPVDDYGFIQTPAAVQKTTVHTGILDLSNLETSRDEVQGLIQLPLDLAMPETDISEEQAGRMKQQALAVSVNRAKSEQKKFRAAKPLFTYILMAVQIIIFVIMEIMGGSTATKTLIDFGAKFNPFILQGEWWRFITPVFIHIGFFHLLMNTFSLYFIGAEVERIYGRGRFLALYLFAGFMGVAASFIASPNIAAGASGAIFGCFGALLYFGLVHRELFMRTMGMNVAILIVINLAYGFSVSNVDNAGHIGGLIGGFLAAGALHLPKERRTIRQAGFIAGAAAVAVGSLLYGFNSQKPYGQNDELVAALAIEEIDKGNDGRAEEMLTGYTDDFEEAPLSLFYLGYIRLTEEKHKEAEALFTESLAQKPELHQAHYYLAVLAAEQGDRKKASEQIEAALEADPQNADYKALKVKISSL